MFDADKRYIITRSCNRILCGSTASYIHTRMFSMFFQCGFNVVSMVAGFSNHESRFLTKVQIVFCRASSSVIIFSFMKLASRNTQFATMIFIILLSLLSLLSLLHILLWYARS